MRPHDRSPMLMTTDAVGGVWTYAVDLSAGLTASGLDVTLAVLGPGPSPAQRAAAESLGIAVVETDLPLDWLAEDAAAISRAGEGVARLAAACQAELIHLNSPALAGVAAFPAPVVGACHSCLATWWGAVRGGEMPRDFQWRTETLRRGYAACDALIAPSFAFMQDTLQRYGVAARGVRNGRRTEGRRFDAHLKTPHVLTSGRLWDEGKNLAALDAAAARMAGEVLAAGPLQGPQGRNATLQTVKPLGPLTPSVMTQRLNEAAVFASLARYEPFGLGVLEAAQAGCALVLSDIPTFRELWSGVAVFAPVDDPEGTARILDALLQDPAECARLGRLAKRRGENFSVEAMTDGTLEVYRELSPRLARKRAAA